MHFIPPYAERLFELIESGQMPSPLNAAIYTGAEDWQSNPDAVNRLGQSLGIPVTVVPGAGHHLPHNYVDLLIRSL